MSAAERVGHAAETIRARWEQGVEESPQMDAARVLDDAGMLLDPEVAVELATLRADRDRIAELERTVRQMCEALNGYDCPPPNESPLETATRVAVRLMEAERREAELEDVERRLLALLPTEPCIERGFPNQLAAAEAEYGAWQQVAEVLGARLPYTRPVDEDPIAYALTEKADTTEESAAKSRAVLAPSESPREDPHDSPLHHEYRVPRDLPETGGASSVGHTVASSEPERGEVR